MGGYDGEIRIKTTMELKQLEKDIRQAERELQQYEKEAEKLSKQKVKMEIEIKAKEDEASVVRARQEQIKKILQQREEAGKSTDTGIYGNLKTEYSQLETSLNKLVEEENQLKEASKTAMETNQQNIDSTKQKIESLATKYVEAQEEVRKYNQQLEEQKQHEREVQEIKKSISDVGNSVKKVTGQMIRWSLSLVGINGMMSLVSRSLTLLKNDNKELNANLNYISFALANAIKPLVEKIVNLVLKLMTYINYIWVKWFGKNLFKDSGISDYEKSLKNSSKSAKQIRKDLMGFDEANKLSEDSSSSGDGFVAPTMDLSKIEDIKPPWWIDWIATHKDDILRVIDALISLFVFKKTIQWLTPLANFFSLFTGGKLASSLGGVLGKIGSILAVAGSIAVIGYSAYTWWKGNVEQGKQLLKIGEKGVEYSKEDAKNFKDLNEMEDNLNYKRKKGNELLKKSTGWGAAITLQSSELEQNVKDSVTQQDNYLQEQIKNYRQGDLTKEQQDQLKQILFDQIDYLTDIGDGLDNAGKDSEYIRDMEAEYRDILKEMGVEVQSNPLTEFWDKVYGRTEDAKKNIGSIIATNIPNKDMKINVDADTTKANSKIGSIVSGVATSLQTALNKLSLSGLIDKFGTLFNNLNKNFGFSFDTSKLKKKLGLRQGGIINNPGRGVALGTNIIGGEAGAEAVLPLDDRTMDRLGQSIARHMTINATMINQMNGRTLSREIQRITNENDFTYNG